MAAWTQELIEELIDTRYPHLFMRDHPQFSQAAVNIMRRKLRDDGVLVAESPIGRKSDPVVVHLPTLPEKPESADFWNAYREMFRLQRRVDDAKSLSEVPIRLETNRKVGIVFISDLHLGSKNVDPDPILEDIELINSCPLLKVYLGGDWCDNFIISALANAHRDESLMTVEIQWECFKDVLRMLTSHDQLLAVGSGNHDAWSKKMSGLDPALGILEQIPALYTSEACFIDLTIGDEEVGEQEYTIYRKHRPTRSTQFNPIHGVQHAYRWGRRIFDVGVEEHYHVPYIGEFKGHGIDRWGIRTGTYKTRDAYAAEFGHYDSSIGTPVVVFSPYEREMVPFKTIAQAIAYLEAA